LEINYFQKNEKWSQAIQKRGINLLIPLLYDHRLESVLSATELSIEFASKAISP